MSQLSSTNSQILLEAGTNELEVLVFAVAGTRCGVNVAKIREVLELTDVTPLPGHEHKHLAGVIRVRDSVIPLADLSECIFPGEFGSAETDKIMLLEFNEELIGFRVSAVERIYRVSWRDVQPVPESLGLNAPVTGIAMLDGAMVPMLDFESLGAKLGLIEVAIAETSADDTETDNASLPIVFADDSPLLRVMVRDQLIEGGFTNHKGFRDGQETWDYLNSIAESGGENRVAALVTDIEMPRMDGLTLTRMIRESPQLKDLPVVLFSSIASDANQNKAKQVGANAQVSKKNSAELTPTLKRVLEECGA